MIVLVFVLQEEVCRQRGGVNASISWDSGISGLSAITRLEGETGLTAQATYSITIIRRKTPSGAMLILM